MVNLNHNKQNGFSLLELMVAMFILAVGLLGIAGLQSYSLKNTQISGKQTYAMMYSQDLIDNIRGNSSAIDNYALSNGATPATPSKNCDSTLSGNTQVCSAAELAQYQLYRLYQQVQESIDSNANVMISVSPVNNSPSKVVTIQFSWQEADKKQNPVPSDGVSLKTYSISALI